MLIARLRLLDFVIIMIVAAVVIVPLGIKYFVVEGELWATVYVTTKKLEQYPEISQSVDPMVLDDEMLSEVPKLKEVLKGALQAPPDSLGNQRYHVIISAMERFAIIKVLDNTERGQELIKSITAYEGPLVYCDSSTTDVEYNGDIYYLQLTGTHLSMVECFAGM